MEKLDSKKIHSRKIYKEAILYQHEMKRIEFFKDRRGISGVVVAILLTVIGIAGVVLLWTVILPMFTNIDFVILNAKLLITNTGKCFIEIEIMNSGGMDITKLKVKDAEGTFGVENLLDAGEVLRKGEKRTFVKEISDKGIQSGNTYLIQVTAEGGGRYTDKTISVTAVSQ
ncbi:MAG: hypothetical protein ABIK75_06925 [candidate division WOR-3 bacterium]